MNTWKRRLLALLSVPLLAVPSAVGVYTYLEPESGPIAAGLAAAGFEVLYVGVNILVISSVELRRYARNVALGAVVTAVLMNTIAHYSEPVFDVLELFLSLIASAPLATLAYAVSVLLHRLSEESAQHSIEDARLHVSLAQRDEEIAILQKRAAKDHTETERAREQAAKVFAELTQVKAELAKAHADLSQRPAEAPIDVWLIAQELRTAGVPLRKIGTLIGCSEGTVRNRTVSVSRNGHGATN